MDPSALYKRSASPNPSHLLRQATITAPATTSSSSSNSTSSSKPRPISAYTSSTPNLSYFPSSNNPSQTQSQNNQNAATISVKQLNQLPPLLPPSPHHHLPPTIKSTLVDVVVEGMGGGSDPGQGWQVPPELVFFLRSLGERLDPFSPNGPQNRSSSASGSVGHTKSLTAALNYATLRPNTDHQALMALFTELVATEKTYLKRINALNQSYAIPLRQFSKSSSTKIIDKYEATSMFGKIESIVRVNSSLLPVLEICLKSLNDRRPDWADRLSSELEKIQKPYRDYLAGYDSIKETEQRLLKKSEGFRQFCERTKEAMYDDGMGRVGLRELLMEPVQRVTRYILIFEQMLKKMSSGDPARSSLLTCISTCNWIAVCELDSHLIKAATMWGLSRSIEHFPAILVKHGRYFIDSIDVLDIIPDSPSPTALHCTLFLFNDTIVIAKKPANGHLSGKVLAGLDDLDRLVAAMKKSKSTTSSLNSVVSGGTDFLAKSLGGNSHYNTPTKLKKGSMRFKGMVDVHDVVVVNEPGQITAGGASEVSFDLYLDRPPQDVSERWSDRPHRHYVVCPPSVAPLMAVHDKSHSLSSHPSSSTSHPHHQHSHSLSSKSSHQGNTSSQQIACLAERDRFLDNLRKSQALVKAADDRSTVMRAKFLHDSEGPTGVIDSYWNLYDKQTYLAEQRKHKVVLQLVGTDVVDPLQFNPEPIDATLPPKMIIRANFNDPDDPDCTVKVRWKLNSNLPRISLGSRDELGGSEMEEEIVVNTETLSSLIVRIIESFRIADPPPPRSSGNQIFSVSAHQQQFAGSSLATTSPTRGFRNKTGTAVDGSSGLPHRIFGSHHGSSNINRTKSITSQTSGGSGSARSAPQALKQAHATTTRSPGGPVWYRNGMGSMGVMPEEDEDRTAIMESNELSKMMNNSESNPSLYNDESLSPMRDTLKGKGIVRTGTTKSAKSEESERDRWIFDSESRSGSGSGLSSCDEGDEDDNHTGDREGYDDDDGDGDNDYGREGGGRVGGSNQPQKRRSTKRSLMGPRLINQSISPPTSDTTPTRARSEPPVQKENQPIINPTTTERYPVRSVGNSRPESLQRGINNNGESKRKVSGSSIGKRSRSVDSFQDPRAYDDDENERVNKRVASTGVAGGGGVPGSIGGGGVRRVSPLTILRKSNINNNGKGNSSEDRQSSLERRREERRVMNRRKNNLIKSNSNKNINSGSGSGGGVSNSKGSEVIEDEEMTEVIVEKICGNNDMVNEVKLKLEKIKNDLKKLKNYDGLNYNNNSSNERINNSGGSGSSRLRAVSSISSSSSIPRSPRKLHLSKVTNTNEEESSSNNKSRNKMIESIENEVLSLREDFDLIESNGVEVKENFERFEGFFNSIQKELERSKIDTKILRSENKVLKDQRDSLELENNQLYEAFNEELDKMYKDVLLPPGEAINSLIEDLKKMSEERGRLITQLGAAKRKLDLEVAKVECYEKMLRDESLMT